MAYFCIFGLDFKRSNDKVSSNQMVSKTQTICHFDYFFDHSNTELAWYSGYLNTKLVWYSNGRNKVGCQMVWFLNAI